MDKNKLNTMANNFKELNENQHYLRTKYNIIENFDKDISKIDLSKTFDSEIQTFSLKSILFQKKHFFILNLILFLLMTLFFIFANIELSLNFWVFGGIGCFVIITLFTFMEIYQKQKVFIEYKNKNILKAKDDFISSYKNIQNAKSYFTMNNYKNMELLFVFFKHSIQDLDSTSAELKRKYGDCIYNSIFLSQDEYLDEGYILLKYNFEKFNLPEFDCLSKSSAKNRPHKIQNKDFYYTIKSYKRILRHIINIASELDYPHLEKHKNEIENIFKEIVKQNNFLLSKMDDYSSLESKLKKLSTSAYSKENLQEIEKITKKMLNRKTIENS